MLKDLELMTMVWHGKGNSLLCTRHNYLDSELYNFHRQTQWCGCVGYDQTWHALEIWNCFWNTTTLITCTASVITSDAWIHGNAGWRIWGNCAPRNQSKPTFGSDQSLGSLHWVQVASVPSLENTLDQASKAIMLGVIHNIKWLCSWDCEPTQQQKYLWENKWWCLRGTWMEMIYGQEADLSASGIKNSLSKAFGARKYCFYITSLLPSLQHVVFFFSWWAHRYQSLPHHLCFW